MQENADYRAVHTCIMPPRSACEGCKAMSASRLRANRAVSGPLFAQDDGVGGAARVARDDSWIRAAKKQGGHGFRAHVKPMITGYDEDSKPTSGFQRVIHRAAVHVESSGQDLVHGRNVLVAFFSERDSFAVHFLDALHALDGRSLAASVVDSKSVTLFEARS